jgi:hypothetical protein
MDYIEQLERKISNRDEQIERLKKKVEQLEKHLIGSKSYQLLSMERSSDSVWHVWFKLPVPGSFMEVAKAEKAIEELIKNLDLVSKKYKVKYLSKYGWSGCFFLNCTEHSLLLKKLM